MGPKLGNREIGEAILKLAGNELQDRVYILDCNVDSVDEENLTCDCTPISSDLQTGLAGVLLMPENGDGLVVFPAVDSTVKVLYSTRTDPFVIQYSDIYKIEVYIKSESGGNPTKLTIQDGEIMFNDGSLGGLTKTKELKTQLDKTTQLINALMVVLQGAPIPEPGNGAPSALQAALGAALSGQSLGDFSQIENELIKQGI